MKKLFLGIAAGAVFLLAGCNTATVPGESVSSQLQAVPSENSNVSSEAEKQVGESPLEMETITKQHPNTKNSYTFLAPKGWTSSFVVQKDVVFLESPETTNGGDMANATRFLRIVSNDYLNYEQAVKPYLKGLFKGETQGYEDALKKSLESTDRMASDFQYKIHEGTYGKIAEVRCTQSAGTEVLHLVRYYREDIPYYVLGALDESKMPSFEKVVFSVADSLQVKEN